MSTESTEPAVMSVFDLTANIKDLLESSFPGVWVSGEISNFSQPQSGHCYLTLKDERAQIRAVIWRNVAERLRFALEDGLEVVCQGDIEVYAPRGSYQLVIRRIEPKGIGALELALRKLREKLAAEGLFDPDRKRPLPRFPRRVAIVTSPTGAAIRDFLQVMQRRWQGTDVLVIPARVQGDGAALEVAAGVAIANQLPLPIDVIVVARGGGSLEDLWAFNEEVLIRAIYASRIPVVSAVGHEIDVTLADLVADVRALTPSEAAERIVPDRVELLAQLDSKRQRLMQALRSRAQQARQQLDSLAARRIFRKPFDLVHERSQRLDELIARSQRAVDRRLSDVRRQLETRAAQLHALSPLSVLGRGYSVTTTAEGALLHAACDVAVGQTIETRLAHGRLTSQVTAIDPSTDTAPTGPSS